MLTNGQIGVRDSKAANGTILRFDPEAWVSFTAAVRTA